MSSEFIKVALFCGGRGASTIARELARRPEVSLTLLINAYDDGLSTGALRGLVPGMLGASDFRKNMSNLMDLHSTSQYELRALLEYRFPEGSISRDIDHLRSYLNVGQVTKSDPPFIKLIEALEPDTQISICNYTRRFFEYEGRLTAPFDFRDCSFGNLIFAGAYLDCGADFNRSIGALAKLFGSAVHVVNVTQGESRTLAAIKADGEVLFNESAIVSPQSPSPIIDLFLLEQPLTTNERQQVLAMPKEDRRKFLKSCHRPVALSHEANTILREADLIIYGCGTQHSSLLPSYMTTGLAQAIAQGSSQVRVFLSNLQPDHDIQHASATDLVQSALDALGDPHNEIPSITHLFYPTQVTANALPLGDLKVEHLQIIKGTFANPLKPSVHSGYATVSRALAMLETKDRNLPKLDIYVDLFGRSGGEVGLQQEFLELPWQEAFSYVRLRLNSPTSKLTPLEASSHLFIEGTNHKGPFSDVLAVRDWLERGDTDYLLTLTGDGEYALRDVFAAHKVLKDGVFGAVFGSRNQSRRQFRSSLRSAYGESRSLYWVSWMGAYFLSLVFGLLFHVIFSDPMTGFRLYRRSRFHPALQKRILNSPLTAASSLVRHMRRSGIEIAEIPVRYRTFKGFTRPKWRLLRGFRNLLGSIL